MSCSMNTINKSKRRTRIRRSSFEFVTQSQIKNEVDKTMTRKYTFSIMISTKPNKNKVIWTTFRIQKISS